MVRSNALILTLALVLSSASFAHADIQVPFHTADINTALLMAGPGGTVTVSQGTYYANVSVPFSGQTLRADGKATIDAGGGTGIFVAIGVTGVVIEDMNVRNCSTGIYVMGDNALVDGCQVRLAASYGVLLNNSDNSRVEHTKIKDTGSHGIYLYLANNCVVEECSVKRATGNGFYVLGNVNSILDNKISDTVLHGIQLGTDTNVASGNLVEENEVTDAQQDGIVCYNMASNSTIQENVVRGTAYDGIDIFSGSNGHTLFKNKVYTSGDNGIEVGGDSCTVSENKCWQSLNNGIYVESGSNSSLYFKNKIKFCQDYGIRVWGTANTFTQNKMKFNLLMDLSSGVAAAANTWINNKYNTSNI
ncbi:MAG: right-handed parallel beta-helix repeat-containing protein [Planctomycetota bacterium]